MAKDEPITPEKQLLKLIENPKLETLEAESSKRQGMKWFSPGAFRGKLSFFKGFSGRKWTSFRQVAKTPPRIHQINLALKLVLLGLSIYLVANVVVMGLELTKASNLMLPKDKRATNETNLAEPLKSINYYQEKIGERDIFNLKKQVVENQKEAAPEVPTEDLGKGLSLVGISWSDDPEAMIEDTESKKTYFVKKGQALDNSVKVVTIYKDRVILSKGGKEFELR